MIQRLVGIAYDFQYHSGVVALSTLTLNVEKIMSPLEAGVDSRYAFEYNDKNVCVNVYLGQYTRFSQGNP